MRQESQVIKLINIYLDGLVSVGNDAGWQGDSVLARLGEGRCDGPRDQSNAAMIAALDLYRDKHHDYAEIERIVWKLMRNPVTGLYITALLVDQYYHGFNERTEKAYSDEDRTALWAKHVAEMGTKEVLGLSSSDALRAYRYGARSAGPRLVRREIRQ